MIVTDVFRLHSNLCCLLPLQITNFKEHFVVMRRVIYHHISVTSAALNTILSLMETAYKTKPKCKGN